MTDTLVDDLIAARGLTLIERFARDAFNEGFAEGLREHITSRGGKGWSESRTKAAMLSMEPIPWQSEKLGPWLSAALEDEHVAPEYKEAINDWFAAGQPLPDQVLSLIERHQYFYDRQPAIWNAFVKLRAEWLAMPRTKAPSNG